MNPAKYEDPEWLAVHHDLERYALDKHCFRNCSGEVYRKGWEWTQCVYGLRKLGMLEPHHAALGVGAGRECVIYYLADHVARVVATDLYGGTRWTAEGGMEADVELLERSKAACPPTVDFAKIAFETQDGTNLTYDDRSFDFCWSLSSIEHFGGHPAAGQAVREMARVTRPGGIVALATELLLLDEYRHEEFFTRAEIDEWLVRASPDLELIEDIDFDALSVSYLIDSIVVPAGVDRLRRHVVLNDGKVQWTSVMLFMRKRG
jgi:SAM-dependent methyltransferase